MEVKQQFIGFMAVLAVVYPLGFFAASSLTSFRPVLVSEALSAIWSLALVMWVQNKLVDGYDFERGRLSGAAITTIVGIIGIGVLANMNAVPESFISQVVLYAFSILLLPFGSLIGPEIGLFRKIDGLYYGTYVEYAREMDEKN